MRLLFSLMLLSTLLFSCNNNKAPDVDNIKVTLSTQRFEQDLFAIDTNQMAAGLDKLMAKYPTFGNIFLTQIINIDPQWSADTIGNYIKGFVRSYKYVYDSAENVFKDFTPYEKEIKKGLQYAKHYFPSYKTPDKIITYVGPLDGYGDILDETQNAFYIGLHLHLGNTFTAYKSSWVQETYPDYISKRFEPSYIPVSAMNRVVLALYPEKSEDKSLVIQMVEKGKRLYLLSKFLPATAEYKLIGFTEKQLKECYGHEASIWALFIQNNLLQTADYNITKNYIGESPKTPELGEASPGNIGSFAGWQIVKKYMDKNPGTDMKMLMEMDPEKLFQEAKYKP